MNILETIEKIEPNEDQSNGSPINRTSMNSFITNIKHPDQELLHPKTDIAQRFLTLLSECDDSFAFQIFPDNKDKKIPAQILSGSFDELKDRLLQLNQAGAGIFVTINRTDGKGRKTENITQIRAVFVDLDGAPLQPVWMLL